jgi:hypothetical protein
MKKVGVNSESSLVFLDRFGKKSDLIYGLVLIFFVFVVMSFLFAPQDVKISLTGFATSSGVVSVNVSESVLVNFTVSSVAWGLGGVTDGRDFAVLDTSTNSVVNGSWSPVGQGFVIKNEGNVNARVWLAAGKDADTFIGGSNPSYQYLISNLDENACSSSGGFELDTFYDVNTTDQGTLICDGLSPGLEIEVHLKLVIPSNSENGTLSDVLSLTVQRKHDI